MTKPIEVLMKAFSILSDPQMARLSRYKESESKFLCGKDSGLYSKAGEG